MAITVDSIMDNIVERVEWAYRNGQDVDFSDIIHEAIDSALIYTVDIVDYWLSNNTPEPENMGAHDSILSAITEAVYFDLVDNISESDIIAWLLDRHTFTLYALGVESEDPEERWAALRDHWSGN